MNVKQAMRCATAVSLALVFSTSFANDGKTATDPAMTGKQKATAIGATTGAVAGAVVGGPVGAVVGGVAGGVIGHQGTDASGKVSPAPASDSTTYTSDSAVKEAQLTLNDRGFNAGAADGQMGPNTQTAIRRFQADNGIAQTGTLDDATRSALGIAK